MGRLGTVFVFCQIGTASVFSFGNFPDEFPAAGPAIGQKTNTVPNFEFPIKRSYGRAVAPCAMNTSTLVEGPRDDGRSPRRACTWSTVGLATACGLLALVSGCDAALVPSDAVTPPTRDAGVDAAEASSPPRRDAGVDVVVPPRDAGVDATTRRDAAVDATPADAGPMTSRPTVGGCAVFPTDNWWNLDVSTAPVDPDSANIVANINGHGSVAAETFLHPDFGADRAWGIPYVVVPATQAMVPIAFTEYPGESDPGPYPVPASAPIEGGGDHHVLVVQQGTCRVYEMYHARYVGPGWTAGSGATWDLGSNTLRPNEWTSCDQAGLPILPGLVRYDEVAAGEIRHALRFTVNAPGSQWIDPARHPGTSGDAHAPPMGARLRLRASFDLTPYHGAALVILRALKRYGMFVADTGTNWFISGAADTRWNDADLGQLTGVPGSAFEVVQMGPRMHW
jgi:hypothetical protein